MKEQIVETVANSNAAEKLSSILNWVEETAKTAEAFAVEQTPLYIQELLAWNFWYSLIWFFVGVFWIAFSAFSWKKLYKNRKIIEEAREFPFEMLWAFPAFLGLVFGSIGFCSNLDWLKIAVAPRVWLVEYVSSQL